MNCGDKHGLHLFTVSWFTPAFIKCGTGGTDSSGSISSCTDVHNDSAVTGLIPVTVSNGNLSTAKDSYSYVTDRLILSGASLIVL